MSNPCALSDAYCSLLGNGHEGLLRGTVGARLVGSAGAHSKQALVVSAPPFPPVRQRRRRGPDRMRWGQWRAAALERRGRPLMCTAVSIPTTRRGCAAVSPADSLMMRSPLVYRWTAQLLKSTLYIDFYIINVLGH
jgi:hypothetical protein